MRSDVPNYYYRVYDMFDMLFKKRYRQCRNAKLYFLIIPFCVLACSNLFAMHILCNMYIHIHIIYNL